MRARSAPSRLARTLAPAVLWLALASCAATSFTSSPTPDPAARAGLRSDLRVFYDALQGTGDWVLIEPLGWVFRPDVNFVAWRPYEDGFWTWNDWYGWLWVSEETFGWATYHYGRWFQDQYQGWVWLPDSEWGPAWVAWAQSEDHLGWAPLPPRSRGWGPGSAQVSPALQGWSFVPTGELAGTNLAARIVKADQARALLAGAKPVVRMAERDGKTINLGPPVEVVERASGFVMPRVQLRDALQDSKTPRPTPAGKPASGTGPPSLAEQARRAGEQQAREAARLSQMKAPPPREVTRIQLPVRAERGEAPRRSAPPDSAAADSIRGAR
jgi:hypothetical protein